MNDGENKPQEQLHISMKPYQGTVLIEFGTKVHWLKFAPREARIFAIAILQNAQAAEDPKEAKLPPGRKA